MEKLTDWNALWRELVEIKASSRKDKSVSGPDADIWAGRALEFKEGVKRKWVRPDSSRDFILAQLNADSTILDIGLERAGNLLRRMQSRLLPLSHRAP
jgi:hypothetical protein